MTTLASSNPPAVLRLQMDCHFVPSILTPVLSVWSFSDLMEENSGGISALNALAARHVDVRMAHVYSGERT